MFTRTELEQRLEGLKAEQEEIKKRMATLRVKKHRIKKALQAIYQLELELNSEER